MKRIKAELLEEEVNWEILFLSFFGSDITKKSKFPLFVFCSRMSSVTLAWFRLTSTLCELFLFSVRARASRNSHGHIRHLVRTGSCASVAENSLLD